MALPRVPDCPSSIVGVGGRLQAYSNIWKNQGCTPSNLLILQMGYILPFLTKPVLCREPSVISGYSDIEKDTALAMVIQDLVGKRAIVSIKN